MVPDGRLRRTAEQPAVLAQAVATAAAAAGHSCTEALALLAPHLPPDLLAQALATATAISDPYQRAKALASLAPHDPLKHR